MTPYFKLSGGGNDFLALVEPEPIPPPEMIRAWCRRGLSLGADGLFHLERSPAGARMRYYNADGRPADLCLNGTRCAVRLAVHLGWAEETIEVETGAGPISGRIESAAAVELELPVPTQPSEKDVDLGDRLLRGWIVDVGVPHFVVPWPEGLGEAPVAELGPRIRSHESFGDSGTNVDFVHFVESNRFEIRSFERGVEAETLACGTGVLAAAATGVFLELLEPPIAAHTLGGFLLKVGEAENQGGPVGWTLTGDARILSQGSLTPEAAQLPRSIQWSRPDA
ncbi:MAG: diaminopimelate epimerase [Thermoanaerobaculia bacterium]